MTSPSQDRLFGTNSSMAIKVPCRVATTANITLSGEQTIDGVAVVTNDRVLVKNQTTASQNGIYFVSTSTWQRTPDFDGSRDVTEGTIIKVNSGTVGAGFWYVSTTGTIVVGTTSLAFGMASSTLAVVSAFAQTILDDTTAQAARATIGVQPYPGIASGTRFVFVGDSKTDGPTDPTSFPYYFSQLTTSADLGTVYNLGVSGYTLANLLSNYTANVKPYAPGQSLNAGSIPTVLGVWIGANDIYQLIANGYTDAADYYADLSSYVNTAIADGFRVMILTIDARGDHLELTTELYRAQVNTLIRQNSAANWIVDTETVFSNYLDTVWWNADTIHYIAAGYQRLAYLVAQTLLSGGTQYGGQNETYLSSSVVSGSAVSLTNGVAANMTSLLLPHKGDWEVWCSGVFKGGATTTVNYLLMSLSTVSATVDGTPGQLSTDYFGGATVFGTVADQHEMVGPVRFKTAGSSTVYAVAQAGFGVSTCAAYGILRARLVK